MKRKKKILIDVNSTVDMFACGRYTGIARTTAELVKAIDAVKSEFPFEVHLFSQNLKGIGCENLNVDLPGHHLWMRYSGWMRKLSNNLKLRESLTSYDLLHIPHNYDIVPYPDKTVVTLHDALFMHIAEDKFDHTGMRRYVPPFIRSCKHVITCSEYSKQDIVETMGVDPDKISVIPWGINHDIFNLDVALPEDIDYPYYLSVSCNAERKRTDKIVRAYLNAWTPCTQTHLLLVWGNPPSELIDEINRHPGGGYIHFESNVNDHRLASLYKGAKVFLFASMFEGFGLPLIEAMACGCPVITARNSSLTEIADGAAYFIEEPLEESLEETISRIEEGKIDLERFKESGLKRASEYRWKETARRTLTLYRKLLDY